MTATSRAAAPEAAKVAGALLRYRIMAFTTGVVLVTGTVALILKELVHVKHMEPGTGYIWVAHGYLYLVYVIVTFLLGLKMRWPLPRYVLIMAAGTIPTMSFVAERYVTRATRRRLASTVDDAAAAR